MEIIYKIIHNDIVVLISNRIISRILINNLLNRS